MPEVDETDGKKQYLEELKKRHIQQEENARKISKTEKLDDDGLRKLDSTLKKTTAFMKKIRNIGTPATPANSLMAELQKLNLSKFLDELAASIAEAKFKSSEIGSVVDVCVFLASRYKPFPEHLLAELKKTIPFRKSDKVVNPSKLRVDIRFLAELVLNGVLGSSKEGIQFLDSAIYFAIATDKTEHVNIGVLLPLCRSHAIVDISDIVPSKVDNNLPRSVVLTPEFRRVVGSLFREYMKSLVEHANMVRVEMNQVHRHIKKQERTRGDASNEDRTRFDELKTLFARLYQSGRELGECVGVPMPEMAEEPSDDEEDEQAAVQLSADINQGRILLWPDDDTRRFYENLLDLCRVAGTINAQAEDNYVSSSDSGTSVQELCDKIEDIDLTELEVDLDDMKMTDENGEYDNEQDEDEPSCSDDESHVADIQAYKANLDAGADTTVTGEENRRRMDEFLERLSNSINREMIDRAAQEFALELYKNKRNRKRLSLYMIEGAPKDRLDLPPFFARFLATIHQIYPEYVNDICRELIGLFRDYVKLTKKVRLDVKIYGVRFIGELIKFAVISKAEALNCLRMLMFELKQSNVDLICCLIESIGSFLYKSPESHAKMKVLLDVMKRKKEKVKDPRQAILLDNAYYSVIPPEDPSELIDNRLPVEKEFILQRLNQKANRVATLRKIDWADDDIGAFALEVISDPTNVPFGNINQLAQCVAALSEHHEWLCEEVLDNVLERVRLALEIGVLTVSQQAVANVAYLGFLYNYEVCECKILMQVLYQLISFHVTDEDPRNLLRIRLVSELCRVISEFFRKGSRRRKFDVFLPYFYRFYWMKKDAWMKNAEEWGEVPLEVEFCITEMLTDLNRDDFPESLEAANFLVEKVEKIYRSKIQEVVMGLQPHSADSDERFLNDIMEEEVDSEDDSEMDFEDTDEEETDEEEDDEDVEYSDEDEEETSEQESDQDQDLERDDEDDDLSDIDDEEEHVHVHTQRRILPEDEQFMSDLDRMLNEAYMTAPVAVKVPAADLTIPPSAIQKLERRITFKSDVTGFPGVSLAYQPSEPKSPEKMKMALLTRGKGNKTVLKAVSMEAPKNLEESWRVRQAQREKEHNEMKRLTLKMNERMMNDDDTDQK
uniref:MIF4G domain-containing protein n=1 Tax=Steinernema glaseri TaxID=37863 RepID=A0A1I7ZPT8_9BILA